MKESRLTQASSFACSDDCLAELRSRNRIAYWGSEETRHAECDLCGDAFTRKPSHDGRAKYCSKACMNKAAMRGEVYDCATCGGPVYRKPSQVDAAERHFCSIECRGKGTRDEGHHNWKGGASSLPYAPGWSRARSREVRDRDGNRCQLCGTEDSLVVHHIDERKVDHSDENLVTLCRPCHNDVHYGKADVTNRTRPTPP